MTSEERLANLAQLTSGIAHEIRNPLQFIESHAAVINELGEELGALLQKQGAELPVSARDDLQVLHDELVAASGQIGRHATRLDAIVDSMLVTASGHVSRRQLTDLNELVSESADLAFRSLAGNRPAVLGSPPRLDLAADMPPALIDPVRMSQAVINLISNALQATAEIDGSGGDDPVVVGTEHTAAGYRVTISDHGAGLPDGVEDHLFEPFFTTKAGREHAGLGLAQVWDIVVRDHQGTVEVDHGADRPTVFMITVPGT